MSRQRHYRNVGCQGDTVFVTTTCLDFVPLFAADARKERMAESLVSDHAHYKSLLHAFVVMPEHLHWVCTVPAGQSVSWLVNRIKSNSGKWLARELLESEHGALSAQTGLNARSVWQRSFRSVIVRNDKVLAQKCDYIHENPVRRGLVADRMSYRWSSSRFHAYGDWDDAFGMPPDAIRILDCRKA